jgi:hypothetical protein
VEWELAPSIKTEIAATAVDIRELLAGDADAPLKQHESRSPDGDGSALHQPQWETSNLLGPSVTTASSYGRENAVAGSEPADSLLADARPEGIVFKDWLFELYQELGVRTQGEALLKIRAWARSYKG